MSLRSFRLLLGAPLLAALSILAPRGDAAVPRDIGALVAFLLNRGDFNRNANNLLYQWGPKNRQLLSVNYLPPRLVTKNEDTIDRVAFRSVAAEDTTRHSAAPLLDGGEMFGSIRYKLGDSKLARQLTPADYDGIVAYLGRSMPMEAAAKLMGMFDSLIIQAMAEHDELANCDAIVTGGYMRRGNNGYFEYIKGPDLENHRAVMGEDWSDPTVNPWVYILARIAVLTGKGFDKGGIRGLTTDQVRTILKNNPFTAIRAGKSNLVTLPDGSIRAQTIEGLVTDDELDAIFKSIGVQPPVAHDLRVPTRTGERRAVQEGALAFIASTGQSEEVIYNQDDASAVPLTVDDTIGFNGIGVPNGRSEPGRRTATRVFDNQSDARVEFEGWQTTGPVINVPEAISVATGIQ